MSLRKLPLPSSQPRVRSPSPGPSARPDVRLPLGSNAGCWLAAPPCGAANSNVPDSSGGVTSHHGRSTGGAAGAPAPAPVPGHCIVLPAARSRCLCQRSSACASSWGWSRPGSLPGYLRWSVRRCLAVVRLGVLVALVAAGERRVQGRNWDSSAALQSVAEPRIHPTTRMIRGSLLSYRQMSSLI